MNEDRVKYIKMLRGRLSAKKLSANALTDFNELRSSLRISTRAVLFSSKMRCFASFAASIFLAAIMTWAFRRAKTLAVSKPMPLAPPVDKMFLSPAIIKLVKINKLKRRKYCKNL